MGRRLAWGVMEDDQIEAKNIESDGPTSVGERTPGLRMWTPSSSRFPGASLHSSPPPLFWEIFAVIYPFFLHPPPTLVSHLYPYLSARPIGYSFWRSVSCCGPHCTIQGSRPHKWGQGVSCGYLIQR